MQLSCYCFGSSLLLYLLYVQYFYPDKDKCLYVMKMLLTEHQYGCPELVTKTTDIFWYLEAADHSCPHQSTQKELTGKPEEK